MSLYDADFKGLVGQPLESVEVSDDKDTVTFRLQSGEGFKYEVHGDCCSYSWIEHVTVPSDVAGAPIVEVKDSGEVREFVKDYEHIAVYQTSFVTPKGEIVLEYRNSSNGYYGGWLSGPVTP